MQYEAMTRQQRYYQRHKEELCRKRREKYHNNEEVNQREKEYSKTWAEQHRFEKAQQAKRHREREKARKLLEK